jgi:hypothetical protein
MMHSKMHDWSVVRAGPKAEDLGHPLKTFGTQPPADSRPLGSAAQTGHLAAHERPPTRHKHSHMAHACCIYAICICYIYSIYICVCICWRPTRSLLFAALSSLPCRLKPQDFISDVKALRPELPIPLPTPAPGPAKDAAGGRLVARYTGARARCCKRVVWVQAVVLGERVRACDRCARARCAQVRAWRWRAAATGQKRVGVPSHDCLCGSRAGLADCDRAQHPGQPGRRGRGRGGGCGRRRPVPLLHGPSALWSARRR